MDAKVLDGPIEAFAAESNLLVMLAFAVCNLAFASANEALNAPAVLLVI
jgi:hypothetical protein